MAQLQKGQSYPELGFSVDGKGIATDLKTGQTLAKADVDSRLQGSDYSQLAKKRGGVAGVFDRNKAAIPAIQTALAMLPGIGPLASAAMGGLMGFDRPGQSGVGFDAGRGLAGAAKGYAAGLTGNVLQGALGAGIKGAAGGGGLTGGLKAGAKSLIPSLVSGGLGGSGGGLPGIGSIGDLLGGGGGDGGIPAWQMALAAAQGVNAANLGKQSTEYAKDAMNTQNQLWSDRAPLRTQGIAGMQAAPTKLPALGALGAVANPFAKRAV